MTDKELLEFAAKAAGYLPDGNFGKGLLVMVGVGTVEQNAFPFDPLNDDGDALRLAVKLEIDLSFYTERDAKVYAQTKHLLGFGTDDTASYQAHEYHKELYKDSDPNSATRRAITRAAAEIGKAMT